MKILLVLTSLTLLASCSLTSESTPTRLPEAPRESKMIKNDTMMSGEIEVLSEPDSMKSTTWMTEKLTGYMNYDVSKLQEALATGQKVALFFHASWCPSCRALDSAINTEISTIPDDTLIVKVDYDTNTELKKKYGVTSQHTTVLIDRDMNLVSKKLGAKNVSGVLN